MKWAASHHVVFRMNLEEADIRLCIENLAKMFGLEPDTRAGGQVAGGGHNQAFFSMNSLV